MTASAAGRRVYLDHNAGSPLRPEAAQAMGEALRLRGNPSSLHREGQAARRAVEGARAQVARLLQTRAEHVVFTSGCTEALHLAIHGALGCLRVPRLVTLATEHHAVLHEAERLAAAGLAAVEVIPVDRAGRVNLEALERALAQAPCVLAVMAVNNETGVAHGAQPAALGRKAGAFVVVDGAQWVGRQRLPVGDLEADAVAFSACKFGGPPGVGALWLPPSDRWQPPRRGGGQERGRRPGTEDLVGVCGMGAAALACADVRSEVERLRALRDHLEEGARQLWPGMVVHGGDAPRAGHVTFLGFPGVDGQLLLMVLDQMGVAASAGAACESGAARPSHVLRAMGVPDALSRASVRFSLGWDSAAEDVDALLHALERALPRAALS